MQTTVVKTPIILAAIHGRIAAACVPLVAIASDPAATAIADALARLESLRAAAAGGAGQGERARLSRVLLSALCTVAVALPGAINPAVVCTRAASIAASTAKRSHL